MGQNSCQPEGLQPESALSALLVLAIERLLPSPGALPSPILAATHTCFIMLGTLRAPALARLAPARAVIDGNRIVDEMRPVILVDVGGNRIGLRGRHGIPRVGAKKHQYRA